MLAISSWRKTAVKDSYWLAMVEVALTVLLFFLFAFEGERLLQGSQTLTDPAMEEAARRSVAPMTQTLPGTLSDPNDVKGVIPSHLASSIYIPLSSTTAG
jgi:hypothetical protein